LTYKYTNFKILSRAINRTLKAVFPISRFCLPLLFPFNETSRVSQGSIKIVSRKKLLFAKRAVLWFYLQIIAFPV